MKPRTRDEEGSALILSLLVVLVVGTLLGVALDYSREGLEIAPVARDERNQSNYAQGAVEAAIQRIRSSSEAGRTDTTCPSYTAPSQSGLSGVTGKTFRVDCTGLDPGSTYGDDQPRYAIHALGTGTEGVRLVAGNAQLYVDGGVYSNGVVAQSGGGSANSLRVNGTVTAEGACSGAVTTTDSLGLSCNQPDAAKGDDPGYQPAVATTAALTTLANTSADGGGTMTCSGSTATFPAGYYSERPDLLLAKLFPSCNPSTYHFSPGVYYFDWTGTWTPDKVKVVGGTLTSGWNPSSGDLGGACSKTSSGVQFVVGGGAQLATKSSSGSSFSGFELCGPTAAQAFNGSPQRIALYGLSSSNAVSVPSTQTATMKAGSAPTGSAFLLPASGQTIDAVSTTATPGKNEEVSLSYPVFTPSLPNGSRVTSVKLRSQHVMTNTTIDAELTTPTGTVTTVALAENCATACTTAELSGSLTDDALWRIVNGLRITLKMKGDSGNGSIVRTASVDGIELEVKYTVPTLQALTCTTGCTFFDSSNNPNAFFHGTVYTPSAAWATQVHNNGETVFDRGIVMRDLAITMSSSSKQETSPFQLPRGTPNGRLVLFRAYVDGTEKVRACVRYTDQVTSGTDTLAYAGWSLTVPHWLLMRGGTSASPSCP